MSARPPAPRPRSESVRERSTAGLGWLRARLAGFGLVRARRGKLLGGVLAGLGRRFGVSPGALRVAFVVSFLLPGPQFLAYLVLWVAMPKEP